MKTLSIVRHAKAERPESNPNDFTRPLTTRGAKDAARLGEFIAQLEPEVDFVVSSPAVRAAQTTDQLVACFHYTKPIAWNQDIYLAGAETLIGVLRNTAEDAEHLLLVGHNPGLEELVAGLVCGAPDNSVLSMATAAVAHLDIDISRWNQLRWGAGQLKVLISAKALR